MLIIFALMHLNAKDLFKLRLFKKINSSPSYTVNDTLLRRD